MGFKWFIADLATAGDAVTKHPYYTLLDLILVFPLACLTFFVAALCLAYGLFRAEQDRQFLRRQKEIDEKEKTASHERVL